MKNKIKFLACPVCNKKQKSFAFCKKCSDSFIKKWNKQKGITKEIIEGWAFIMSALGY